MNDEATPGRSGSATVRPFLLAPRDWQAMALREAAELTGTPEGAARLAESKRYGALADEIERLRALHRKVYGLACDGTIGVLDPHKTCGGGVFTLWDDIKRAADGVA